MLPILEHDANVTVMVHEEAHIETDEIHQKDGRQGLGHFYSSGGRLMTEDWLWPIICSLSSPIIAPYLTDTHP